MYSAAAADIVIPIPHHAALFVFVFALPGSNGVGTLEPEEEDSFSCEIVAWKKSKVTAFYRNYNNDQQSK